MHGWCHVHLDCTCKAPVLSGTQHFQVPGTASIPVILVPDFCLRHEKEILHADLLHAKQIHGAQQRPKLRNVKCRGSGCILNSDPFQA